MKMNQVRTLGKKMGLTFPIGTTKIEAIRMIQKKEGNFDCFARGSRDYCNQTNCLFLDDCLIKRAIDSNR